jgi:hypothetical protein
MDSALLSGNGKGWSSSPFRGCKIVFRTGPKFIQRKILTVAERTRIRERHKRVVLDGVAFVDV